MPGAGGAPGIGLISCGSSRPQVCLEVHRHRDVGAVEAALAQLVGIARGGPGNLLEAAVGFFGPLKRLDRHESARLDEDVYQVRRLTGDRPEPATISRDDSRDYKPANGSVSIDPPIHGGTIRRR